MPLASLHFFHRFGPFMTALVATDAVGEVGLAEPHQRIAVGVAGDGAGDAPVLRPYRGRIAGVQGDGAGDMPLARPMQRFEAGLVVSVNQLSQDDVTGAVLEAPIEGTLTLKQALRLLIAQAAGNATGLDGNPVFKSLDGSKTRLAGTIAAGVRTVTTRDGT